MCNYLFSSIGGESMNIKIPEEAEKIIEIFEGHGFEAFVVGGCVRDSLLNKEPSDWDITTNALPEETIKIFKDKYRIIPTGLKHGTLTILAENGEPYEVTTYRIDGEYTDGRHPDEVKFTTSLREDLARRDFTINAIAFNKKRGIVDYFDGLTDLEKKMIKCVGKPSLRFKEDGLRMLRCIRFSAQLGFSIDVDTRNSIQENAQLLENISMERIQQEFNRTIINAPELIYDMWELGLMQHFIPEFGPCIGLEQKNPHHVFDLDKHTIKSMMNIENNVILRLTMFLHDFGKVAAKTTDEKGIDHFYTHNEISCKLAKTILKRMKYDNNTIDKIDVLIKYHDYDIANKKTLRRLLSKIGVDNFRDLLKVKEADMLAQNPVYFEKKKNKLHEIKKMLEEILIDENCFSIKDLKLNGNDLIQIGFKKNKTIGETLNYLLGKVIENPELNNREVLLGLVKNKISENQNK